MHTKAFFLHGKGRRVRRDPFPVARTPNKRTREPFAGTLTCRTVKGEKKRGPVMQRAPFPPLSAFSSCRFQAYVTRVYCQSLQTKAARVIRWSCIGFPCFIKYLRRCQSKMIVRYAIECGASVLEGAMRDAPGGRSPRVMTQTNGMTRR